MSATVYRATECEYPSRAALEAAVAREFQRNPPPPLSPSDLVALRTLLGLDSGESGTQAA